MVKHAMFLGGREQMDAILLQLLHGQLQSMGIFTGDAGADGEWKRIADIRGSYGRWLEESRRVLTASGNVGHRHGELRRKIDLQPLWRQWEELKREWLCRQMSSSLIRRWSLSKESTEEALFPTISTKSLPTTQPQT